MAAEIASVVVDALKHGIEILAANKDAIEGSKAALDITKSAGSWAIERVKSAYPAFAQHYRGTPKIAQENAAANILHASSKIQDAVELALADGSLTIEQIESAVNSPAFAVSLKDALLKASESDSDLLHDQFAKLLVAQMGNSHASPEAQMLRIATRLLADLSDRQLLLLGAISVMLYCNIEPVEDTAEGDVDVFFQEYLRRVQEQVAPYLNIEVRNDDLRYLEGLNLVTFNSRFEEPRVPPMLDTMWLPHLIPETYSNAPVLVTARRWVYGDKHNGKIGFSQLNFTQPGWVLGAAVDAHLKKRPLDISNISD